MILDDKGRLFGKISVIDLFAFVVIAGVVAVAYFKFGNTAYSGVREPEQEVLVKFYTPALEDFTAYLINEGDLVVNESNNNSLGSVTEVVTGESVSLNPDENGNMVTSPKENYSQVEITSKVMGRLSEGSVVINGNLYTTGSEIIIRVGKTKLFLKISGIEAA